MELFKQDLLEEINILDRISSIDGRPDDFEQPKASLTEIKQFDLIVNNFVHSFEDPEENPIFFLSKISTSLFDKFPNEYFSILVKYDMINLMIKILASPNEPQLQALSILILLLATSQYKKVFFGLPFIVDKNLFNYFMKFPSNFEIDNTEIKIECVTLYFSRLVCKNFLISPDLAKKFIEEGLYQFFIELCTSLNSNERFYLELWFDIIHFFSGFSFPDELKGLLLQVFEMLYASERYSHFVRCVDTFIESSNDELMNYVYQSEIFTQIINVLIKFKDCNDLPGIKTRKICMFSLYRMIIKDVKKCDVTFFPINVLVELVNRVNISDQVSALQLLTLYLKNDPSGGSLVIDEFLDPYKNLYEILIKNSEKYSFKPKIAMVELFILSVLKANQEQLHILYDENIFPIIFENFDSSNTDLVNLLNDLLRMILSSEEYVKSFLLPSDEIIYRLAEEIEPKYGEFIKLACQRIDEIKSVDPIIE